MNVADVQGRLAAAGYTLVPDGLIGPATWTAILAFAVNRTVLAPFQALGAVLASSTALGQAVTSDLGTAHFIAQAAHETAGFSTLYEFGGPTYFARYDGRVDLGNTEPGDGYRFRGRGIFQVTGRANYARLGVELAEPLEADPDLAARPDIAVLLACRFWADHGIQMLADADDSAGVTRKINGGLNGLADRQALTARVKRLLGLN